MTTLDLPTDSGEDRNLVNIPENIVNQYPMLLSGRMWGTIEVTDLQRIRDSEQGNPPVQGGRFLLPSRSASSISSLRGGRSFPADEWIDVPVNSCGLDPELMTRRKKPVRSNGGEFLLQPWSMVVTGS